MANLLASVRLSLVVAITLLLCQEGKAIKINSDGGYELLIAFQENTPIPAIGVNRYVDNVKTSFSVFSNRLWVTTKSRFYVKSVDILLPSHWNADSTSSATTQSFQIADVRLSPNVTYPHAENPNICGKPGNFIELPDSFFNVTNSGPYGLHWKSLLHTWALYRWGVHAEHGYVGDSKFPYAQRDLHSQEWTVTGCSDEKIMGRFTDITNPDNSCESEGTLPNNCRFVPEASNQNATTSLMHFHWVESVTDFCDEHNHDKYAANKQNALCDHKSIWEVIRETPDYLAVTSQRNEVPNVVFNTVKHSATPLFYILLDRGLVQAPFSIANKVPRALATFITNNALSPTLAAIGAYPGPDNSPLNDLVEWSEIGANSDAFLEAIGSLRADGPLERDFSRALVAAADKIKQKNHPNGAVLLLIKYGADVANFRNYLPESEVINALNEGNIIFNTIELNFTTHTGYSNLANVARGTGGGYTVLNNVGEVETNINNVLSYVRRTLLTQYTELEREWKVLRKDILSGQSTIPVPVDIKGNLEIFVSSSNPTLSRSNFNVTGYNYTNSPTPSQLSFNYRKTLDWSEEGSKSTYKLDVPQAQLIGYDQINVQLSCTSGDCSSNVLARAEFTGETSRVQINVLTSLENGHADLSSGQPISIFTKITKNGLPVQDAIVTATVTETSSSRATSFRLNDDGEGTPDVVQLDGIYSAYFAPENDGSYKLSVNVEGDPTRSPATRRVKSVDESSFIRLLPIDQGDVGCGAGNCDAELIEGSFSQNVELAATFSVVQTSAYIPSPTKIISLFPVDRPDLNQLFLYWNAPFIPGRLQAVTSYEMRSAPTRELLVSDFDNQALVPIPPTFRPKPAPALETIQIARPASTTYYALRSIYRGRESTLSNVANYIVIVPTEPTTVPTGPTSPTDPTGPTTVPTGPTTVPTGPTTVPTGPTTVPTGPTTVPTGPTTVPTGPTTVPTGPTTVPTGPTTVPTIVPTGPTTTGPTDPTSTTPASSMNVKAASTIILSSFIILLFMNLY
ncbi:unnamed protein product [Orchesella dallaii]|uniref:Calcium-activated chloride channel N-terminal domain-containing protein n=1 Tax=Orchesella dallaii TaxID=48710 RepID=A0ABP1QQL8_9HEXA